VSMARSGPHNHKGDAPDSTATITPITENIISPESGQEHTRDGKRDGADDVDDENHGWPQRSTVSHFVRPRSSRRRAARLSLTSDLAGGLPGDRGLLVRHDRRLTGTGGGGRQGPERAAE
jgi:hypothetical protein